MSALYTINGDLVQNRAWSYLKCMKIKSIYTARFVIMFLQRNVTYNKFETNKKTKTIEMFKLFDITIFLFISEHLPVIYCKYIFNSFFNV